VNAVGDSTCAWTASTADAWIHFVSANTAQGTGVFRLSVDQSPAPRHGTVNVIWNAGGASIGVDQVCGSNTVTQTLTLTPELQTHLLSASGCTFLTGHPIQFDVPWLTFVSTHGGGYQLEFGAYQNTGPERTGHVITDIGTITVVQLGGDCVTAIAPTSQVFDENGGSGTFSVTTAFNCAWEATPRNDETYTLGAYDGVGSGVVTFNMPRNQGGVKAPYFLVGGTFRFQITQSACPVTVSPLSLHVPTAGGTFLVVVADRGFCLWTISSNYAFITAAYGDRTSDSGTVRVVVAPNQTGQSRSGSVQIRENTVVVTQEP
jgi:hypothetical protein